MGSASAGDELSKRIAKAVLERLQADPRRGWSVLAQGLAGAVARHLAGRDVAVRFVGALPPEHRAADGSPRNGITYREGERAVILLDPSGLSPVKLLGLYLHEVAHARLHAGCFQDSLKPVAVADLPNGSLADRIVKAAQQKREAQADELAGRWAAYAEQVAPGGSVADRLEALLSWKPEAQ